MNNSSYLHTLIHSLTMSERRYFKIFASNNTQQGTNNSLRLFDILANEPVFDKKKIDHLISKEPFSKNARATKHYLYNLILKSLRAFHEGQDDMAKLRMLMQDAEILYKKRLFKLSLESLNKAKDLAEKKEYYTALYEILRKICRIHGLNRDPENLIQAIKSFKKYEEKLKQLEKIYHYTLLSNQFTLQNLLSLKTHKKEIKELGTEIRKNSIWQDTPDKASFSLQYLYYHLLSRYTFDSPKENFGKKYQEKLIALLEQYSERITDSPTKYIALINNYAICLAKQKKIDAGIQQIKKLKTFITEKNNSLTPHEILIAEVHYYTYMLEAYLLKGDFLSASRLEEEIIIFLKNSEWNFTGKFRRGLIYYNLAYSFYGISNFSKAIDWLNLLLNDEIVYENEGQQAAAHILRLVVQYEMGNYTVLEYITKHAKRFLKKKDRFYSAEQVLIKILEKIAKAKNKKEQIMFFKKLQKNPDLNPGELENYFNIKAWLESKITGRDFANIIKERYIRLS